MTWSELPGQIDRFARVLQRDAATRRSADHLLSQMSRFVDSWKVNRTLRADLVPLPLPRDQGLHPVGTTLRDCYLSFRFDGRNGPGTEVGEFQVLVEGELAIGNAIIELEDHWRIDSETPEGVANGRESHPRFHFQRGGHAQDRFAKAEGFVPGPHTPLEDGLWKAVMQYSGPRVASLPFDPILAFDYCVAQNNGVVWRRLRNTPEYTNAVKASQKLHWLPLLESLAQREGRADWLGQLVLV